MKINTSRFGPISLTEEDVLKFPEGILGFAQLRTFILVDDPRDEIFAWLQSCENSGIAFPVLEPELFMASYDIKISKSEYETLKAKEGDALRYFNIITIPEDPTQMTANLKAPLVINPKNRIARQCVLQDNNLAIREPIFTKLQQRVVQNPQASIRTQAFELGVAVQLNEAPVKNLDF